MALLISPRSKEPWNSELGTCTNSPAAVGFVESSRPTANIEKESTAPAKGPASEMSTFVLRSGRIDLNYMIKISNQQYIHSSSSIFHKYKKLMRVKSMFPIKNLPE